MSVSSTFYFLISILLDNYEILAREK